MKAKKEEIFDSVYNIDWSNDSSENLEKVSQSLKNLKWKRKSQAIYLTTDLKLRA